MRKHTVVTVLILLLASRSPLAARQGDAHPGAGQVPGLSGTLVVTNKSPSTATIIDLQGEKAKLADKTNKLDPNDEKRFAGIAMTGRSVVFLVDTSGSMEKTDSQTAAPMKWPNVCDTIARVMRTVPTLERYQVVTFAKDARWLIGNGDWRMYEGEKSVAEVREAPEFRMGLARFQGFEAVSLRVVKQPSAETLATARRVREALPGLQETLPEGMHLSLFYDQGELVQHALGVSATPSSSARSSSRWCWSFCWGAYGARAW